MREYALKLATPGVGNINGDFTVKSQHGCKSEREAFEWLVNVLGGTYEKIPENRCEGKKPDAKATLPIFINQKYIEQKAPSGSDSSIKARLKKANKQFKESGISDGIVLLNMGELTNLETYLYTLIKYFRTKDCIKYIIVEYKGVLLNFIEKNS